jgi:integrase
MNKEIAISGSIQMTKRSKYWKVILNIPTGEGHKTKPKWISTQETDKMKAYKKFVGLVDEYEALLNDPRKSYEEKLMLIFLPKKKRENDEAECEEPVCQKPSVNDDSPVDIFSLRASQIKFVDLLRNWKHAFDDIEGTTVEGYENNFNMHIISYFEDKDLYLSDVRRRDIQQFVNHMGEQGRLDGSGGLGKESVKKYVSNIRKVCDLAVDEEWIEDNPVYNIKYPIKIFPKVETEPLHLDLDQLLSLLGYVLDPSKLNDPLNDCDWGYASGIVFAAFYALRRSEIFGLRWEDFDWKHDIVRIDNAVVRANTVHEKRPKSKASRAPMPLMPLVKSFLLRLKEYQGKCAEFYGNRFVDSNYVCCRKSDGTRFGLDYLNQRLQKDLKCLYIEPIITQHELRHSTATLLRSLGFAEQEIQSWLRHADLDTTMHYAHDSIKIRLRAGEVLNSVLNLNVFSEDNAEQKETAEAIAV